MANNELSGPLILLGLYQRIQKWNERKYNYRFVINPETIGSLSYLYKYKKNIKKISCWTCFNLFGRSK